MSRTRAAALAALAVVVLAAVAWWALQRAVDRRFDEIVDRGDAPQAAALERVQVSAERTLTASEPGTTEHLHLSDIRSILPTPSGTWIGTTGGLRLRSGDRETIYTARSGLLRNAVAGLAPLGDALVVAHPEGGLSVIRGALVRTVSRPDLVCTSVAASSEGVLVGTADQGLLLWDGEALSPMTIAGGDDDDAWEIVPRITAVTCDTAGRIWVATFDQGVALRDDEGWHLLGVADGLADPFVTSVAAGTRDDDPVVLVGTQVGATLHHLDRVQAVGLHHEHVAALAAGDEVLLAGTFGGGLALFESGDWVQITTPDLPSEYVQAVAVDDRSRLWIGTRDGLVLRDEGRWRVLAAPAGPPGPCITAITAVPGGGQPALWAGTFERGVGRLLDGIWARFGSESGLPSPEINALAVHRGVLWVGTNAGAAWFSEGLFHDHPRLAAMRGDAVTALLSDGDALWLGTNRGVVRLSAEGDVARIGVRDGLVNSHVYALARAPGALWAGTLGGISGLRPDGGVAPLDTPTVVAGPGALSGNWVNALLSRGDELYVGSYGGGVDRRAAGTWTHPFPGAGETLEINPGAAAWVEDRAVFGTLDRGLLVVDADGDDGRTLDAELGLGAASVTAVHFDGAELWIGTTAGILRVPASQIAQ
jgi:ligand-binding sensor domain-containing protein